MNGSVSSNGGMIMTGQIRSTGMNPVPVPCHQYKFHTDLPGIEPGPPRCGEPGDNFLKFHLLVHVDHILFIAHSSRQATMISTPVIGRRVTAS